MAASCFCWSNCTSTSEICAVQSCCSAVSTSNKFNAAKLVALGRGLKTDLGLRELGLADDRLDVAGRLQRDPCLGHGVADLDQSRFQPGAGGPGHALGLADGGTAQAPLQRDVHLDHGLVAVELAVLAHGTDTHLEIRIPAALGEGNDLSAPSMAACWARTSGFLRRGPLGQRVKSRSTTGGMVSRGRRLDQRRIERPGKQPVDGHLGPPPLTRHPGDLNIKRRLLDLGTSHIPLVAEALAVAGAGQTNQGIDPPPEIAGQIDGQMGGVVFGVSHLDLGDQLAFDLGAQHGRLAGIGLGDFTA